MTDDLVQRIRKTHREIVESDGGECELMVDYREAADRIEALEAYAKHERSLGAEPWMMENNELKQRIEALEEQLRTSRGLLASRQAMIEAQTQRIIELEHGNNKLRGINADLVEAHTFATDPANSHWQGDVIKKQCDRINELQAALRDSKLLGQEEICVFRDDARRLEAALREIVVALDDDMTGHAIDIARRALEGK